MILQIIQGTYMITFQADMITFNMKYAFQLTFANNSSSYDFDFVSLILNPL